MKAFAKPILRAICRVIGHTTDGLSGSLIKQGLADCGLTLESAPAFAENKRDMLYRALDYVQGRDGNGNRVGRFMTWIFFGNPAGWSEEALKGLRRSLNEVLGPEGLAIGADGKLGRAGKAGPQQKAGEEWVPVNKMIDDQGRIVTVMGKVEGRLPELLPERPDEAMLPIFDELRIRIRQAYPDPSGTDATTVREWARAERIDGRTLTASEVDYFLKNWAPDYSKAGRKPARE